MLSYLTHVLCTEGDATLTDGRAGRAGRTDLVVTTNERPRKYGPDREEGGGDENENKKINFYFIIYLFQNEPIYKDI